MELIAPLDVAAAGRPHPNETSSGDAWAVAWLGSTCRIAIIDGAGHGELAEDAAHIAIATFEEYAGQSPVEILRMCHARLRGTRGAVMAVAVVDFQSGQLELAGVGNIEAHLLMDGREQHPISQRGLLGNNMPTIRPFTTNLPPEWLLVMHSDGIRSHWSLGEAGILEQSAEAIAHEVLARHTRQNDDACVVVIRPSTTELR